MLIRRLEREEAADRLAVLLAKRDMGGRFALTGFGGGPNSRLEQLANSRCVR